MNNILENIFNFEELNKNNSIYSTIFMLLILMSIFYFIIILPQTKKSKIHQKLIYSIKNGDEILTSSGILGKIIKISKNGYITLYLNENTNIVIRRDFIKSIVPKGTIDNL